MKYILFLAFCCMTVVTAFGQNLQKISACVVTNGQLKEMEIDYNPATGERSIMVNGVRKEFYSVYPKNGPDYAEGQNWFINNDTVKFRNRNYQKYGLPRVLGVNEIQKSGVFKGVGVYVEAGFTGLPEIIYIPVRQGCEFQPYQMVCGYIDFKELAKTKTTIQVKAIVTGLKGKINYAWSVDGGKIIKGQGTGIVTVDFSGLEKSMNNLGISLTVKDAQNCPVRNTKYILVKE